MIAIQQNSASGSPSVRSSAKEQDLRSLMREAGRVLVAYSGGVDSSYLAKIATEELGGNAECVIGLSPSVSLRQQDEAFALAEAHGFNIRSVTTSEMELDEYRRNDTDRCYFCKAELYSVLSRIARDADRVVMDGTNADDLGDIRPGRRAAEELSVRSPLAELGISKLEIRELSRRAGLATWDKPAAPCLSSRIAHGIEVTSDRLARVEQGEEFVRSLGFREFRVRVHGELARVEIAKAELGRALSTEVFARLADGLKKIGFKYVTLDLEGFRSGSMNVIDSTKQSS